MAIKSSKLVTESLGPEIAADSPLLAIRLFGTPEVRVTGIEVSQFPSRRSVWLLAILALRNGRPIERQSLAGMLWPDSSDESALHNLRQTLAGLRRSLGAAGDLITAVSPRSLVLQIIPSVWVDALEFDEASRSDLEGALKLYRGSLMEGCDEPFIWEERTARERALVNCAEKLAERYIVTQDRTGAREMLRRAVSTDPYRESAVRALMTLLAEAGEAAAALNLYRELRLNLRRDLNAEPDPETKSVYRAIRSGDGVKQTHKPRPVERDDLLPVPLTALLGREAEVREVTSLLERCRLVTLTGAGGVGKTRLALAVAEATGDNYLDGIRFVDLAPVREPARIASTIAACLQLSEQAGRTMLEMLVEKIRGLDLLVVLDNCEHLTQGVAETVEALLSASPALHILATSRQSIEVAGELLWRVPPLSMPTEAPLGGENDDRSEYLLHSDSVRLFVQRAGEAGAFESPSAAELEAIGSICRRLDGIPLAIELAAARTSVLSPSEIEVRLRSRFDLLARSGRTNARHQTLNAAMEWSWDLLTEPERRMLMRLCVFRGGWTLEAAEAVAGDPSALDLIASLVDRSMINSKREACSTRYSMLETIRQFATERLNETQDRDAYFNAHRDFFLDWAELERATQFGPEETKLFSRFEAEHYNLRAAHDWSHASGQHLEGLRLAVALARFWDTHGHLAEGRRRLELSMDEAKLSASPDQMAGAHVHAGWMATVQHDTDAAIEHYEIALVRFRELEDLHKIARALNCLSVATSVSGDLLRARELLLEALEIFEMQGNQGAIATVLTNLAELSISLKDNESARGYLEKGVATFGESTGPNSESRGLTLCSLSLVDCRESRYAEAMVHAMSALEMFVSAAAYVSMPEALSQIAIAETAFEEWDRMARLLGCADELAKSLGVPLAANAADDRDSAQSAARAALGDASFRTAYELGSKMSIEQAIEFGLNRRISQS